MVTCSFGFVSSFDNFFVIRKNQFLIIFAALSEVDSVFIFEKFTFSSDFEPGRNNVAESFKKLVYNGYKDLLIF